MQLLDGRLQLDNVGVPGLNVGQGLFGSRGVHDDPLGEDCRVALLQHIFQLLISGGSAS